MNARAAFDVIFHLSLYLGSTCTASTRGKFFVILGDVGERCGYWKIIYHSTFEALVNQCPPLCPDRFLV